MPDDWRLIDLAADVLPDGRVRLTALVEEADGTWAIKTGDREMVEWLSLSAQKEWLAAKGVTSG